MHRKCLQRDTIARAMARGMIKFGWAAMLACVASAASAALSDDVTVVPEPIWGRGSSSGRVLALRVTIQNEGRDFRGVLSVTAGGKSQVPVEMPRGSQKEYLLYPATDNGYGQVVVNLQALGQQLSIEMPQSGGFASDSTFNIGVISDTPGGLSFLKSVQLRNRQVNDAYVKPGAAPDRGIGYSQLQLLFLGEGCERLTDPEVNAIKRFVLLGGKLAIPGGAASPLLQDERWRDFIPAQIGSARTESRFSALSRWGENPGGPISILDLVPKPNTRVDREGGEIVSVSQQKGLGRVWIHSFNLFENPMRSWTGRAKLIEGVLFHDESPRNQWRSESVGLTSYNASMDYGSYPAYTTGGSAPYYGDSREGDPFQASLPPTLTIILILGAFWLTVVPIHFFILNKLKKGELAWFTAPLISLGFAGLLFMFASGLYKSGLSQSLSGAVMFAKDSDQAIFLGRQQLFFPNGGKYNLDLQNVEALLPVRTMDFSPRRVDTSFQDDVVDVGQIMVNNAGVTNLNFKEFSFAQAMTVNWKMDATSSVTKSGEKVTMKIKLTNTSPYKLENPALYVAGRAYSLESSLEPGATSERTIDVSPSFKGVQSAALILKAQVKGLEAGSPLGKPVEYNQQDFFYSFGDLEVK